MYTIYKHKLVKGMDDAILQEMSNDFMNMIIFRLYAIL